jgi:hypothetical protein
MEVHWTMNESEAERLSLEAKSQWILNEHQREWYKEQLLLHNPDLDKLQEEVEVMAVEQS